MGAAGRGALRLGPEPAGRGGTGLGEAGGGGPRGGESRPAAPEQRATCSRALAPVPWLRRGGRSWCFAASPPPPAPEHLPVGARL